MEFSTFMQTHTAVAPPPPEQLLNPSPFLPVAYDRRKSGRVALDLTGSISQLVKALEFLGGARAPDVAGERGGKMRAKEVGLKGTEEVWGGQQGHKPNGWLSRWSRGFS